MVDSPPRNFTGMVMIMYCPDLVFVFYFGLSTSPLDVCLFNFRSKLMAISLKFGILSTETNIRAMQEVVLSTVDI